MAAARAGRQLTRADGRGRGRFRTRPRIRTTPAAGGDRRTVRNAFDYRAFTKLLLEPASADGSGDCALCSIDPLTQLDHSSVITRAADDAVLIVDGVFAFRPEINAHWDFRIWLHVDLDTSVQRGTRRDRDWAGSTAEALLRERYLAAELLHMKEVDPIRLADIVIDNSPFDRPRILAEPTRRVERAPPP